MIYPYIIACCGLGDCNTGRYVPQVHIAGTLNCLMLGGTKTWLAKWVSQLGVDHVVWVGDCTLWGFVLSHE